MDALWFGDLWTCKYMVHFDEFGHVINIAPPLTLFLQIGNDLINGPWGILPVRKSVPGTENFNPWGLGSYRLLKGVCVSVLGHLW